MSYIQYGSKILPKSVRLAGKWRSIVRALSNLKKYFKDLSEEIPQVKSKVATI